MTAESSLLALDLFQIYLICFGVGLFFALVSAFFADAFGSHDTHLGAGHADGHVDGGFGTHEMPGFSPWSPTTLAAFVTAFGGFGVIFTKLEATSSPWINLPLATAGGFAVAAFVFVVFNKVFRATQGSSEGRVAELTGHSATVITPIAPDGVGEIAYVQGGTRYTAPARAVEAMAIPSGASVWIVRIEGSHFYVTTQ